MENLQKSMSQATVQPSKLNEQLQRFRSQRLLKEQRFHSITQLPAGKVAEFISNERQWAAIRIQRFWRGRRVRIQFLQQKNSLRENKSAVLIQKQVRKWLKTKSEEKFKKAYSYHFCLTIERIAELQREIDEWQRRHVAILGSEFEQQSLHRRAQNMYREFKKVEHIRKRETEYQLLLLRHLRTQNTLLNHNPVLKDANKANLPELRSTTLLVQTQAKKLHRQSLQFLKRPWWKKLNDAI